MALPEHITLKTAQSAIDTLCSRHSILTALYVEKDGRPLLLFDRTPFPIVNHLEFDASRSPVQHAFFEQRYDLTGLLIRAAMSQNQHGRKVLLVSMHHLLTDNISTGLLGLELQAIVQGRELSLTGLNYRDYLVALEEWFASSAAVQATEYWRSRLPPQPSDLYPWSASAQTPSEQGGRLMLSLGIELSTAVEMLRRTLRVTGYTLVVSAIAAAIAEIYGRETVHLVGVTDGRERPVLRPIIGYLADKVHHSLAPSPSRTFRDLVHTLWRDTCNDSPYRWLRYDELHHRIWPGVQDIAPVTVNYHATLSTCQKREPKPEIGLWIPYAATARRNPAIEVLNRGGVLNVRIDHDHAGAKCLATALLAVFERATADSETPSVLSSRS